MQSDDIELLNKFKQPEQKEKAFTERLRFSARMSLNRKSGIREPMVGAEVSVVAVSEAALLLPIKKVDSKMTLTATIASPTSTLQWPWAESLIVILNFEVRIQNCGTKLRCHDRLTLIYPLAAG